jgi:hypothetical protein
VHADARHRIEVTKIQWRATTHLGQDELTLTLRNRAGHSLDPRVIVAFDDLPQGVTIDPSQIAGYTQCSSSAGKSVCCGFAPNEREWKDMQTVSFRVYSIIRRVAAFRITGDSSRDKCESVNRSFWILDLDLGFVLASGSQNPNLILDSSRTFQATPSRDRSARPQRSLVFAGNRRRFEQGNCSIASSVASITAWNNGDIASLPST